MNTIPPFPATATFTPLPELAECKRDLDWLAHQLDGMKWADLGGVLADLRPDEDTKYVDGETFKRMVRTARKRRDTLDQLSDMVQKAGYL